MSISKERSAELIAVFEKEVAHADFRYLSQDDIEAIHSALLAAAAIRAAEAWKDRGEDRKVTIELRTRGIRVGIGDATQSWHWWAHEWEYPTIAESISRSLYRATSGPED